MEPRELWERHSVLAVAFCGSDDQVRDAQGVLDEAQAARTRMLAAFAVTVGSDGAVADLLGLTEREVRIARRTVGKDDARTVAECLLAVEPAGRQPRSQPQGRSEPSGGATVAGPAAEAGESTGPQAKGVPSHPGQAGQSPQAPALPAAESTWSAALDAVLVGSWHTGLDLTSLAAEFGLDLAQLIARAQKLTAEGRLNQPASHEDRAGRHRRLDAVQAEQGGYSPGAPSGQAVPGPRPNDDISWQQAPPHTPPWDNTTTAGTDWNGIVSQWSNAPATQSWEYSAQYG
ncbi:hypothetical protein [Streptomyces sp. NPDC088258]|uniref:hypothetical protein n=1 Tax=Streptomyces sp. NPDC088258 TaxID=3365849 RepID=UPI0038273B39